MIIIYQVANKAFSVLFASRESAEAFMRENATTGNGLEIRELQVLP